jgi:hypothetical protein
MPALAVASNELFGEISMDLVTIGIASEEAIITSNSHQNIEKAFSRLSESAN